MSIFGVDEDRLEVVAWCTGPDGDPEYEQNMVKVSQSLIVIWGSNWLTHGCPSYYKATVVVVLEMTVFSYV